MLSRTLENCRMTTISKNFINSLVCFCTLISVKEDTRTFQNVSGLLENCRMSTISRNIINSLECTFLLLIVTQDTRTFSNVV